MAVVMHERTRRDLERWLAHPGHALLLVGERGVGKREAAHWLATQLGEKPLVFTTQPSSTFSISIDAVHDIQQRARFKQSGEQLRIHIVEDAAALGIEAQNAFLKLLEEPPAGNVFILTAQRSDQLLPTVVSRLTTIEIQPPALSDIQTAFSSHPSAEVAKHYAMFGGRPSLIEATLEKGEHPLLKDIALVKELLASDTFGRLVIADQVNGTRQRAMEFCEALQLVLKRLLSGAAAKNQAPQVAKLSANLSATLAAQSALAANGQVKLALDNLLLQL